MYDMMYDTVLRRWNKSAICATGAEWKISSEQSVSIRKQSWSGRPGSTKRVSFTTSTVTAVDARTYLPSKREFGVAVHGSHLGGVTDGRYTRNRIAQRHRVARKGNGADPHSSLRRGGWERCG